MLETHFANLPVTDLAVDDTYMELFYDALVRIARSKDPLKKNYIDLNPKEYFSFPAVIRDAKIACFSGAIELPDRWGQGIARVSTRMWIDYPYRFTGLVKFRGGGQFMNTTYCLPLQIQKAKDLGFQCIFISREGRSNIGFKEYINLIKTNCDVEFKLMPQRFNTCGQIEPIPESCKQFVAIHPLTPGGELIWNTEMGSCALTE